MIGRFWCLGTGPVIILGGVAAVVTAATFALTNDVSLSLEISMVQFMTLVRDGMLLIQKEVKAFKYLDQFKDMMDPNDIKQIERMMEDLHISTCTQQPVPNVSADEEVQLTNDFVLAGWNDELFDATFLQALDSNDGWVSFQGQGTETAREAKIMT